MDRQGDIPTKEKILRVCIDLFSEKSYRDISVRDIAKAVGIKASSLYKHYKSKEDILESVFSLFREKMTQTEIPQGALERFIESVTPEGYFNGAFDSFMKVMWSPEVVKIAKIITIEQQRNRSVRNFFLTELIEKPTQMLKRALDIMARSGKIDDLNTQVVAEEYNAYIVYLYYEQNFLKENLNLEEIERKMRRHNAFYASHVLKKERG